MEEEVSMKKCLLFIPTVFLSLLLFQCETGSKYDLPDQVHGIISDDQLDQLIEHGLVINEGSNPPNIEGVYIGDSLICTYDSDGDFEGTVLQEYYYRIENQTSQNTADFSYRTGSGSSEALGKDSFISGSDQDFTLFAEVEGTSYGDPDIQFRQVKIYSGTLTTGGLAHWGYGFVLTYKSDDPEGRMMAVNDHRVFIEQDDLAANATWPVF